MEAKIANVTSGMPLARRQYAEASENDPRRPFHPTVPLQQDNLLKPGHLPPVSTVSTSGKIERFDSGYGTSDSIDSPDSPGAPGSDGGYDLEAGRAYEPKPVRPNSHCNNLLSPHNPPTRSPSPSLIDFDGPVNSREANSINAGSLDVDSPSVESSGGAGSDDSSSGSDDDISDDDSSDDDNASDASSLPSLPDFPSSQQDHGGGAPRLYPSNQSSPSEYPSSVTPTPQDQVTQPHVSFSSLQVGDHQSQGTTNIASPPPEPLFAKQRNSVQPKPPQHKDRAHVANKPLPTPPVEGYGQSSPSVRSLETRADTQRRTPPAAPTNPAPYPGVSPLPTPPSSPNAPEIDDEDDHVPDASVDFEATRRNRDTGSPPSIVGTAARVHTPPRDPRAASSSDRQSPAAYPWISVSNASPPPVYDSPDPHVLAADVTKSPYFRSPLRPPTSLGLWKHLSPSVRDTTTHGRHERAEPQPIPPELRTIFGLDRKETAVRAPGLSQRQDSQPCHGAGSLEGVWKLAHMMKNSPSTPVDAFKQFPNGEMFSVTLDRRDTPCPLQKRFRGTGAIRNELADLRCHDLGVRGLLEKLNWVLGTEYPLDDSLYSLLETYVNDTTCDFGRAYGRVRRGWFCDVNRLKDRLERSRSKDEMMRSDAIDYRQDLIIKPRTPPRRVWDLYSNRVLPFWVLLTTDIPKNLWAVSHSWMNEKQIRYSCTRINGFEWAVPIPSDAELDHVRIELLNLGAEYVWLDVLCLRQHVDEVRRVDLGWSRDEREAIEAIRQREWKLDVPTIGYVFRCKPSQVVITYFSGLGRPFRLTSETLEDSRSWFNRVWTVQETTHNWLLGGLIPDKVIHHDEDVELPSRFYERIRDLAITLSQDEPDLFALAKALRSRQGTHHVDRVSALGLLLNCDALPIYDTKMRCEDAWSLLLQQMTPRHRTDLLLSCPVAGNAPGCKWRPPWSQMQQEHIIPGETKAINYSEGELLKLPTKYHEALPTGVVYWNYAYVIEECQFVMGKSRMRMHVLLGSPTHTDYRTAPFLVETSNVTLDPNVCYAAVGMADLEYWVLGAIVDSHEGMEYVKFEKIATFRMPDARERERLWHLNPGYSDTPILYL